MGLPIEALWSCYQNLLAERDRLNDENNALRAEVDRLKRGDWTPEEIHDICHNLHGKVAYLTNVIRDIRAAAFGWDASTWTRAEWDAETDRLIAGPAPVISEVPPKG